MNETSPTPVELFHTLLKAAYPVVVGRVIPAHTPLIVRHDDDNYEVKLDGFRRDFVAEVGTRTLVPLPSLVPDDCDYVWDTYYWGQGVTTRELWTRQEDDTWVCHTARTNTIATRQTAELVNPRPVDPEEGR